MKLKKIVTILLISCMAFSVDGCGKKEEEVAQNEHYEYLNGLKDGGYYILHKDNTVEPLIFPYATFEKGNIGGPSNSRIFIMNQEEYDSVPVLYEGDKLIYYYTGVLTEEFHFERFEDMGYSIGIAGMDITNSGRYSIPTGEDSVLYPEGDTAMLQNFENEIVLMDSLGGVPLRGVRNEGGEGFTFETDSISRCGSITGLKKDKSYKAEIYAGTRLYNYSFTADKRFFASMETTDTINFNFESETIANIDIPSYYNSGFYTINSYGIFRYVKGKTFNEKDDFNIPNVPDESDGNTDNSISEISTGASFSEQDTDAYAVRTVNISREGTYKITLDVEYEDNTANGFDGLLETEAKLVNPSETTKWDFEKKDEDLFLTIEAKEKGTYSIYIDNLDYRTVEVKVERK